MRKPAEEELKSLPEMEIIAPTPYQPSKSAYPQPNRKKMTKLSLTVPLEEWKKRLALAPDNIIKETLENTTQLAIKVDTGNRSAPRRHYKARFSFFKFLRLRDEFHADTFFPDASSAQNHTCVQIFAGKETGY